MRENIVKIDLLMPAPHMVYETKGRAAYTANEHGIVSVLAHHTHELVAMGGIPLPPVTTISDGSTVAWTDPRIVAKSNS
jgi:hypothetical protein